MPSVEESPLSRLCHPKRGESDSKALRLCHDTMYLKIKPCPTATRVPFQRGICFVTPTSGNSRLYTFTQHGTCVMLRGPCSGVLLCRQASPTPSLPKTTEQVLPMITRRKRAVASPALMYNSTLMCCLSSLMSATLGTSIGGTRKPRAMPS